MGTSTSRPSRTRAGGGTPRSPRSGRCGTPPWPGDATVRVRIGLHVGSPSLGDEGYTGVDVVRASRIANAGHGGQIVVSARLLSTLGAVASRDLGEHRLEGSPAPERIHQLLADDLPRDFPPLRNTISTLGAGISVVLADDTVLLREGIARLLADAGFDVVAQSGNAGRPPPTRGHAPAERRDRRHPDASDPHGRRPPSRGRDPPPLPGDRSARPLAVRRGRVRDGSLRDDHTGIGYLLKDRVADVDEFASAVRRIAEGGSVLDPAVVAELFGRSARTIRSLSSRRASARCSS